MLWIDLSAYFSTSPYPRETGIGIHKDDNHVLIIYQWVGGIAGPVNIPYDNNTILSRRQITRIQCVKKPIRY